MTTGTKQSQSVARARISSGVAAGVVVLTLLLLPQACSTDSILAVDIPQIINPGALNSPAGAAAAYAGGIGDFAYANDGDGGVTEGQILVTGVMTDEYIDSETFPTRIQYDSRGIDERNATLTTVFRNLQRARTSLETATGLLRQYAPTPGARIGETLALSAFIKVYAGENYCSGVPFSTLSTLGQPLTTQQMFDAAIQRLDSAIATDTTKGDSLAARSIVRLARVGKARALLDLALFDSAAAVAASVPLAFKYQTTHTATTTREQNGVNVFNGGAGRFSVADGEGTNGLNFRTAGDPRVTSTLQGFGFDGTTPLWVLGKYPSRTSPITVADGIEAQLIVAEDQLHNASYAAWLATLNGLRANGGVAGLAPLTDPGPSTNDTLRVNLQFRERAFWLFATGHRLGDLRRLVRQYGRNSETVFPTGPYFKGGLYGTDVNIPVPFDERNNPNFQGCLNRAA
jgi:starch-binding outer membrane protein, SusD/RagB family